MHEAKKFNTWAFHAKLLIDDSTYLVGLVLRGFGGMNSSCPLP